MNKILFGDCRASLRAMAAEGVKVQTCVTSPPYFGLRDYGHDGQIGLEETPEQFIAELVDVFRCVRDVLADDGTLWVNIGDSYNNYRPGNYNDDRAHAFGGERTDDKKRGMPAAPSSSKRGRRLDGLKEKDLIGIPWMLAFALRADGWYLRQDIIWHKPNPMPESVRDRCTKSHEYVFLLSKSDRYFFDHEAVKEDAIGGQTGAAASFKRTGSKRETPIPSQFYGTHRPDREDGAYNGEKRNRRSVWSIATKPYKGAHFAVFPSALVEPCILAGTSAAGHCQKCGARWERQVERTGMVIAKTDRNEDRGTRTGTSGTMVAPASSVTVGWAATCECGCDPVPDVVLDPFMGSGTTAAVSVLLGRHYAGCELNADYKPLQDERIAEAVAARSMPAKVPRKKRAAPANDDQQLSIFSDLVSHAHDGSIIKPLN